MTEREVTTSLQSHKDWLANQYGGGRRADFRGAGLRHVSFEGADLRWADFRAADCTGANFTKADCRNADFRGADMTNATCIGTVLVNARLDGTNLSGVDLREAVMEYAQFRGASFNPRHQADREKGGVPDRGNAKRRDRDRGMER